ncbi:uncharacterized protein PG998_001877 [Apiospora kogelbergensis]|uniref:Uncharacterized protein n=1 Tax=Apiospora kogelbergensis TaxID=1337665 RepID=A0AAW0QSD8_9PEZI
MCDYEEFIFDCEHSVVRLKSHCHFARNDPNHECFGVKVLRHSWPQHGKLCDDCALIAAANSRTFEQQQQHQGPYGYATQQGRRR